jgi:hypothetical protein
MKERLLPRYMGEKAAPHLFLHISSPSSSQPRRLLLVFASID